MKTQTTRDFHTGCCCQDTKGEHDGGVKRVNYSPDEVAQTPATCPAES